MNTEESKPFQRITMAELQQEAERVAVNLKEMFGYKPWTFVGVGAGGLRWSGMVLAEIEKLEWPKRNMSTAMAICKLYMGTEKGDQIKMMVHGSRHLFEKRHVVCFDDIADSGTTRRMLGNQIVTAMGAKEVWWSAMLVKERWREAKGIELCGRIIPDDSPFLVGMGMDFGNKFRDLDFVEDLAVVQKAMDELREKVDAVEQEEERPKGFLNKLKSIAKGGEKNAESNVG